MDAFRVLSLATIIISGGNCRITEATYQPSPRCAFESQQPVCYQDSHLLPCSS